MEMDLSLGSGAGVSAGMIDALRGRTLVWTTNANVPLKIEWGGEGVDILRMIGVPESMQPTDINVGRSAVRDEFNIALMAIGVKGETSEVKYLTKDDGSWHKPQVSAFADYIVATRVVGDEQDIYIFDLPGGGYKPVAYSRSIDRWPSIKEDGRKILFHSYRDGSPYGDLFLASRENTEADEWSVEKVFEEEGDELLWPMLDASGVFYVLVGREPLSDNGFVQRHRFGSDPVDDENGAAEFRIESEGQFGIDPAEVKFPSLSRGRSVYCWNEKVEGKWQVNAYGENENGYIGPGADHPGYGWVQPCVSPDGRFVVFIDDNIGPGTDRIGIYDIELDEVLYIAGCGGNVMFPSISDQPQN